MKKAFSILFVSFTLCFLASAQVTTENSGSSSLNGAQKNSVPNRLLITPQDIRLIPDGGNFSSARGYHLYVKKHEGLESILLTETTKDPEGKEDSYAYRAAEWNAVNGDEIRYLDGKPLVSNYSKYSLVDSSVENLEGFGECFHIYIPSEIIYGYPWTRNGSVKIGRGTFINIRAFQKKYADYSGDYYDNPYMFDLGTAPKKEKPAVEDKIEEPERVVEKEEPIEEVEEVPALTDDYNPVAAEKFDEIGETLIYSKGPETLVEDIMKLFDSIPENKNVDVVFAIDATGSMHDDIDKLRKELVPNLLEKFKKFSSVRLGLVLYRDYQDGWYYRGLPIKFFDFTESTSAFLANLKSFRIYGTEGGDIPEAVYEAMYASIEFYKWREDAVRKVILIGDAEPHPRPRGKIKITKELVLNRSKAKDITVNAIILPDEKSRRGR